jgi:ABC-2 type transport system permease protein
MKSIEWVAIYVLWLREMKRFVRAKSRVVGMLGMPLFFLVFMGLGFSNIPGLPGDIDYIHFLVPGIIGMGLLFTSVFAGLSVLWDKEFGFLKEIMVAPVSRLSIVLGRTAGNATTALIQGILILAISAIMGFRPNGIVGLGLAVVFMLLIATTFIGLGLIFASNMEDMHGFSLIMNFVIFPIFFLSGALFPIENLPEWIIKICYVNPLTYGVDGLRGALVGVSSFPIAVDILLSTVFSIVMVLLGAYFFKKSESV